MVLSERLQFIYDRLLPHHPVWDFCCDHGYLGATAAASELFSQVHFVDQVPEIIRRLEKKILGRPGSAKCTFKSLRAENLQVPIHGNVVIAGVGAHTIFKIIEGLSNRGLLQAQRLILCPQRDEGKLEKWFQQPHSGLSEFLLSHQEIVLDRVRERTIFVYDRAQTFREDQPSRSGEVR